MVELKYLNDVQNAYKLQQSFIFAISTSCKKIGKIYRLGQELYEVKISQNCGVCVKMWYEIYLDDDGPILFFAHL